MNSNTSNPLISPSSQVSDPDAYKLKLQEKLDKQTNSHQNFRFAFSPANTSNFQNHKPPTPSNHSLKSPKSQSLSNKPNYSDNQSHGEVRQVLHAEIERPFKQEDSFYQGSDKGIFNQNQLDSICMRIQNLRRNLASSAYQPSHQMESQSKESTGFLNYLAPPLANNQCTFRHESDLQFALNQNKEGPYEKLQKPREGDGILVFQDSNKKLGGTQEFEEFFKFKENLSPRLLSTYQKDENWDEQTMKSDKQFSSQKENFNQDNVNVDHLIKQKEDFIRKDVEQKYQKKITELEKRSQYLDRSLELIEDMKSKFMHFESQQNQYNDLLLKYNNLLYQYNNKPEVHIKQPIRMFSGTQVTAAESEAQHSDPIYTNQSLNHDIHAAQVSVHSPQNMAIEEYHSQPDENYIDIHRERESKYHKYQENKPLQRLSQRSQSVHKKLSGRKHASPKNNDKALKNNSTILNIKTNMSHGKENAKSNSKSKPRVHNQRLCSAKRNQETPKSELNTDLQDFSKETFASLHKQIDKLKKDKKRLQEQVNSLQERVSQGPMQCCCEDLKNMFESRAQSLEQIAEHWKEKTQLLVGKYYKSLQIVREDQTKLRSTAVDAVEQLREFQEKSIRDIMQKQMEVQVYYEKRLKKVDQENKKLTKRIVEKRNKSQKKQGTNSKQ